MRLKMKVLTNSKKNIDYGHYIDCAVPSGADVLTVGEACSFREMYVLRPSSEGLPFRSIVLQAGAVAEICIAVMPGCRMDIPLYVDLAGEGAAVNLSGAFICLSDERVSLDIVLRHRAGHCRSGQVFNGIAGGTSRAAFNGKIIVAPDARLTEAYQTNRNLVISDGARVETRPQLEIYADDVKCSHGATVGSLNAEELFYMRSRGVPEHEAKLLQMLSFLSPVFSHLGDERVRESLEDEIETELRKII